MTQEENIQGQLIEDLNFLEDWEDKYNYVIDLSLELEKMPEDFKSEENIIKGCQSKVWLVCSKNQDNTLHFLADSDSIIAKGLIALLLKIYSNKTANYILETEPLVITKTGLADHLSPNRANGLASMVLKIKQFAQSNSN